MATAPTIRIEFELDDSDLDYFRNRLKESQTKLGDATEDQIISGAVELAASIEIDGMPSFLEPRVAVLRQMIEMLKDDDWKLEGEDRQNVLNALIYFADENDMIPDNIPGIGLLDDAIMIDLAAGELSAELEAYVEFCLNREDLQNGVEDAQPLEQAREDLQGRMRRQRRRNVRRRGASGSSSYFLFGRA